MGTHAARLVKVALAALLLSPAPAAAQQDVSRCRTSQLGAAAKLCQAELTCWSAWAKSPARDPSRERLSRCLSRAESGFTRSHARALSGGRRQGAACGLDAPAEDLLADELLPPLEDLAGDDGLLAGVDGSSSADTGLRSGLLRAAAKLCGGAFAAEGRSARSPDPVGRAADRARARSAFLAAATRALAKAADVVYGGPSPEQIADAVEALVDAFAARTAPSFVTLAGTIRPAASTFVDSDVNDPRALYVPNDSIGFAQRLVSPATLGGYVSLRGAGARGPSRDFGDATDFFQVFLVAGERVALYLGGDPEKVDLELCLYAGAFATPDCSLGNGAVEDLVAQTSGVHFVEVFPSPRCRCGSSYVLTVGLPGTSEDAASEALRLGDDFVPGQLVVRLAAPAAAGRAQLPDAAQAAASCGLQSLAGEARREMLWSLGDASARAAALAQLGAGEARAALAARLVAQDEERALRLDTLLAAKELARRPEIASVDLNYLRRTAFAPNDPFYAFQWHYPLIHLPQAWDVTSGSPDVIVAVLDTGILPDHPDLQGQLVAGYDFVSDRDNARDGDGIDPDPRDPGDLAFGGSSSFHGTHVTGTIVAAANNGRGVTGVAPGARVMPLRVLGRFGGTDYDILQAVRYALQLPNDSGSLPPQAAAILNLSLGGPGASAAAAVLFQQAYDLGAIVIAAAGNNASSASFFPASYDGVFSVSALDIRRARAPYSNFGPTIDVAAPGGSTSEDRNGDGYADGVLSTLADDSAGGLRFNYVFYQGTSMAAPHVAGVAALMKSVWPEMTAVDFDQRLALGALSEDLGAPDFDETFGYGLIDARKAVSDAVAQAGGSPPADAPFLVVSPRALSFGFFASSATLSAANAGGGALTITGVSASAPWLSVSAQSTDDSGLGRYLVEVDRDALPDGTSTATLSFGSSANPVNVGVTVNQGIGVASDAGTQYVLLVDPGSYATVGAREVRALNGLYSFEFRDVIGAKSGNVATGSYLLVSGTDLDNDGFICDAGEACGAYPTLDLFEAQAFAADRPDLDFETSFPAAVDASSATPPGGVLVRRAPFRLPGGAAAALPRRGILEHEIRERQPSQGAP